MADQVGLDDPATSPPDPPPAASAGARPATPPTGTPFPATPATAPARAAGGWVGGYAPWPQRIGPYRVIGLLGEGGMGTVYLAEQDAPVRRDVALKVLRTAAPTDEVVARFAAERQALALMEHPHITRVYDAGVTDAGLPYFVMERVSGTPITEYADARALTVRQRVALFRQVCGAVQHAHQKGIIHRDLKPSNVLVAEVDGQPHCKVIDFGIAKAVTPGPDAPPPTVTGTAVGTPAYMSPEQFTGSTADVDTRADVYALGVMLYELLAGVRPFDDAAGWALVARQTTGDVPTPSTRYGALPDVERTARARARGTESSALRHALAGDLDAVLLKALERDRERRYGAASALAEDLGRFLRHEPVAAARAGGGYRLRKFVRRHRGGVGAAAGLLALLVLFAGWSAVQARRLAEARGVAVARQAQAEELVGFMLGDLRDRLAPAGRLDVLDAVGQKALAYFDAVPEAELSDEELYRRAQALVQLGQVRMDQAKLPEAGALFVRAVGTAEALAARDPGVGRTEAVLGRAHFWAGNAEWAQGNTERALPHLQAFVARAERLAARFPDSTAYRRDLASALSNIGSAREAAGDLAGALGAYRRSVALDRALADRDTAAGVRAELALGYNALAQAQRKAGDLRGAVASHDSARGLLEAVVARDTAEALYRRYLGITHFHLSGARLALGDAAGAAADADSARAVYAALVARDAANAEWRQDLVAGGRALAQARLAGADAPGALRALAASEPLLAGLLAATPVNQRARREWAAAATLRARALLAAGRHAAALPGALAAADTTAALLERRPRDLERMRGLGEAYLALGDLMAAAGDPAGAAQVRGRALAAVDSAARATGQTELLAVQAAALAALGRTDDAWSVITELRRRGYRHPDYVARLRRLGLDRPA